MGHTELTHVLEQIYIYVFYLCCLSKDKHCSCFDSKLVLMPWICKPYLHRTDTVLIRLHVSKLTMCKYTYLGKYTGVLDVLLFNADVGRHDIMKQAGLGRKHGEWIGPFSPQNDVKLTRRGREGRSYNQISTDLLNGLPPVSPPWKMSDWQGAGGH